MIPLNEEQKKAVHHQLDQPACLIAGAGSGKTRVLTERVRYLLENEGIVPGRILCLTFTNKAAGEMMHRLAIPIEDGHATHSKHVPYVSTIHSLALSFIRRGPTGFGLLRKVSPLDDYDQSQMIKKIIERMKVDVDEWRFREKIGFHRARGLGFAVEYTPEYHEEKKEKHGGYHALEEDDLKIWKVYEEDKTKGSVVDFDDMLHLCVRRGHSSENWRKEIAERFDYILMDEAQDTNPVQWEFVNMLLASENKNFFVVGDVSQSIYGFNGAMPKLLKDYSENWRGVKPTMYTIVRNHRSCPEIVGLANAIQRKMTECQPAGTKVRVVVKPCISLGKGGTRAAQLNDIDIAELTGNEKVQPWKRFNQYTPGRGQSAKRSTSFYSGPMLCLVTRSGKSTRITPTHHLWVRFNKKLVKDQYIVYLMFKEGVGFRIGTTKFKRFSTNTSYGLTKRLKEEQAHAAWILRVCTSRQEAETWEEIYSTKYGIPESVFLCNGARHNKPQSLIDMIFREVGDCTENARILLKKCGLLIEYPLVSNFQRRDKRLKPWLGFFRTAAANLIPLVGLVDVPLPGHCVSDLIVEMKSAPFEGEVHSLNVDKWGTYIADGIVVGNSIPIKMESWRGMQGEKGVTKRIEAAQPQNLAEIIAHEIWQAKREVPYKENAILVRSAAQIRDIEAELVRLRIPYIVRGGRGLLGTEEVRDMLAYLKLAVNPNDFVAFTRAVAVPRRGIGDVAMEKIRQAAAKDFDHNLIESCKIMPEKLMTFAGMMKQLQAVESPYDCLCMALALTNYSGYLKEKYKKDPNRVDQKIENINRLKALVQMLVEDRPMTTEDLVFQLTLDKQAEDDPQGMAVISTIHAAKGLEWKRVYVFGVVEGLLPHRFSVGSAEEIEEERRLWYVAVTRARDYCAICIPQMVFRGKDLVKVQPSRFLYEIGVLKRAEA